MATSFEQLRQDDQLAVRPKSGQVPIAIIHQGWPMAFCRQILSSLSSHMRLISCGFASAIQNPARLLALPIPDRPICEH